MLGVATATVLAGCATEGRKINQAAVGAFRKGQSTPTEVRAVLGDPNNIAVGSDGTETWTYTYKHANVKGESFVPVYGIFEGGTRVQKQETVIKFAGGTLAEYTSNYGGTEMRTGWASGTRVQMPGAEGARPVDGSVPGGLIDGLTMKERLARAGIPTDVPTKN